MPSELHHSNEHRKFTRANMYGTARYTCPARNAAVEIQARISDISEGGASLITTPDSLSPGTLVTINFVLPGNNGGLVTVGGRVKVTKVIEKNSYRSGVEFLGLGQKTLLAIREYVASHTRK